MNIGNKSLNDYRNLTEVIATASVESMTISNQFSREKTRKQQICFNFTSWYSQTRSEHVKCVES